MDAVLEIHLPMAESAAERYFALEESVTAALESGSLGSVDGNDVGQGEFTIFMIGPDGRALLRAVRALLPADLLHPGAYAVIRNEKDEEVAEEQIPLTEADVPEAERPTSWKPLSFGAIKGGNSADVEAFWVPLQRLWQALPTAPPSRARATQLIVIWHVAGEIWDRSIKTSASRSRVAKRGYLAQPCPSVNGRGQ